MTRAYQFAVFAEDGEQTLAFNSLTKKLVRVDMAHDEFLTRLSTGALPTEIEEGLLEDRFLVPEEHDDFRDFVIEYRSARYGPQPLVIYVTRALSAMPLANTASKKTFAPGFPGRIRRKSTS